MFQLENVEKLLGTLIVDEEADDVSVSEVQSAYELLGRVKAELVYYIKQLMPDDENYIFTVTMPFDAVSVVNVYSDDIGLELIQLPFLVASKNVWGRLKEDKDNPVFKVLDYFYLNVHWIRTKLSLYDVPYDVVLTRELLDEYKIFDLYGIYSYESMYANIWEWLIRRN